MFGTGVVRNILNYSAVRYVVGMRLIAVTVLLASSGSIRRPRSYCRANRPGLLRLLYLRRQGSPPHLHQSSNTRWKRLQWKRHEWNHGRPWPWQARAEAENVSKASLGRSAKGSRSPARCMRDGLVNSCEGALHYEKKISDVTWVYTSTA